MQFVPVGASHHEENAHVEKANRTVRSYVDRLALKDSRSTLVKLAAAATFNKNTFHGHRKSLFFGILFDCVPNLPMVCNTLKLGFLQDFSIEVRRRQLQASLNSNTRIKLVLALGQSVFILRDNVGWIGPAIIKQIGEDSVEVNHNRQIKSPNYYKVNAVTTRTRTQQLSRLINDHSCEGEIKAPKDAQKLQHAPYKNALASYNARSRTRHQRTEAERLVVENQNIIADLPDKRDPKSSHFTCYATPGRTSFLPNKLALENQSWISSKAFDRVLRTSTFPSLNIIGSDVAYRRKSDSTSKTWIVSWDHRDIGKDSICGNAPSLNLDSVRLLFSLAAEHCRTTRKMNVKSAYLQAKRFCREVFVCPSKRRSNTYTSIKHLRFCDTWSTRTSDSYSYRPRMTKQRYGNC